ncbi:MAG: glycosyltransferase [Pseudomonadota bacterium]
MAPSPRQADAATRFPRTTHCIGSLGAGGAERQLVNLLLGLAHRGHHAQSLLTINSLQGDAAHYADLLAAESIEIRTNNTPIREEGVELIRDNPETVEILKQLPPTFNAWTFDIWVELSLMKPDVAHFWLDHSNIWGGPAALLAGVPAVVLSTRNVHPGNFPYLHTPYFHSWYQLLEKNPRVHLINNSYPGAASYAEWIGAPLARFDVVLNGVNLTHLKQATTEERARIRRDIGVPLDAPAIVGAFRLSDEKRPLLFVETVARAMTQHPNLHAVMMGEGPLRDETLARAAELGVADRFHAIGRRSDVSMVMSSMDVFLHTAWWEGTPNVVLEAQQLMLPVVVSEGGGAADAVADGQTGHLVPRENEEAFAEAVIDILENLDAWRERAKTGPKFIAGRFSIDRMIDETLDVQRRACEKESQEPAHHGMK